MNELRKNYHFYDISNERGTTTIRLMTSFATTDAEIDGFMEKLADAKSKFDV